MTFEVASVKPMPVVAGRPARWLQDLTGYGLVSLAALALDYGLLVSLTAMGVYYLLASAIGFLVGLVTAYVLSARLIFADRRAGSAVMEACGFAMVGIAGLALTQALIYVFVSRLGIAVALAKIPTTGLVFVFNFVCRRSLVFTGYSDR